MRHILFSLLLVFASACAQNNGTSTGNPLVDLKISSYNSTLSQKTLAAVDAMNVSSLKFCFKRLRFKQTADATVSENQDFYLGEVTISNLGTDLTGVAIPTGTYSRIEFDLEPHCPSGKSIELTNSNGSFSTNSTITIRFDGTFVHTDLEQTLNLNIQQIVSSLNTVASDSDVRAKAEAASGSF